MEYYDLIRTRESIRNYDPDRPVPREVLEKILDAGRLAPSACNNQLWKFIYGITPLGYPRSGFKKTLIKTRKPLNEIVEFL